MQSTPNLGGGSNISEISLNIVLTRTYEFFLNTTHRAVCGRIRLTSAIVFRTAGITRRAMAERILRRPTR